MLKPILLVEDSPKDLELTLLALERSQLANEVIVVRDGEEALDYLFRRGTYVSREEANPAVVLLDLKLPKVDGLEVLRRVRADPRTHRLPVVILTSSKEDEDLVRGYDLGANSYVRKPVAFEQFVEAVRTLQVYWLVLNEPPPGGGGRP